MTMPQNLEQLLAIAEDASVELDTRIQAIKEARAVMEESEPDAALRKRFDKANAAVNWERIRRNRDDRPEAVGLLKAIRDALPDLEKLREECDDGVENGVSTIRTGRSTDRAAPQRSQDLDRANICAKLGEQ
jgi:hypothetical protein